MDMDKFYLILLVLITLILGTTIGYLYGHNESEIKYVPTTLIEEKEIIVEITSLDKCLEKIKESDQFKKELWGLD